MSGRKTRWNYGFGSVFIRKTKQGKVRWHIDFQEAGNRVREVVKHAQTRAEAVLQLQERVAEAFSKANGDFVKKAVTFSELSKSYLADYAKVHKKSWKADQSRLDTNLIPYFGKLKLNEVTPHLIEKYRAKRLSQGVTKSTVNRELALMKKMFSLAIDWKLADDNPVKKVKMFSEKDNLKERILSKEEEQALLENCADHLKPIIIVALNTGMRKGELLQMRWDHVDLGNNLIAVEKTKSGRNRYVNINVDVSNQLDMLTAKRVDSEFVFVNHETGKPFTDLKRSFLGACRRAGIQNLRFHDLRHTFASRLVESGVDLITIKELLGHSTVKITERYTHPNQDLKRKAVDLLVRQNDGSSKSEKDLAHICHLGKIKEDGHSVTSLVSNN